MWEESLIFMLIYLGLFFLIPDEFRNKLLSRKYLAITIVVGILGACLGLYGIYTNLYSLENYQAVPLRETCGETGITCGADIAGSNPNNTYCSFNQKKLLGDTIEKVIPFNMRGQYVRVRPLQTVMKLSQIIIFDKNASNIGRNKPVTTNISNTTNLNTLVDGYLSPRTSGWESDGNNGTYVQVNLGSVQEIGNIKIIALTNDALRISVLQTETEEETTGKCIPPPTLTFPTGADTAEQEIIGPLMNLGYNGQTALNILQGIKNPATRFRPFTEYGLTDSQAAAAYNNLYSENLSKQRAGWEIFATWDISSRTLTISSDSLLPLVNMTVKSTSGIPTGAKITAVSGNTITIDKDTTTAGLNKPVKLNGNLTDTSYYAEIERIRPMLTMALITYDKSDTLSKFMSQNKTVTVIYQRDISGNPLVDASGNPIITKTSDNGEKAALNVIIGVTKSGSKDPNAIKSRDTVRKTESNEGVRGYDLQAAPTTTNWSTDAMSKLPMQTTAMNFDTSITPPPVDRTIMDAAASNTLTSAGYSAPYGNESGVASTSAAAVKEVFWLGWGMGFPYNSKGAAERACTEAGADGLATLAQLVAAQSKGAQWCARGWLDNETKAYPMQEVKSGCGNKVGINSETSSTAGATCFGYKPSDNEGSIGSLPNNNLTQTINVNKTARYVRVRPSVTSGDGYLHFSQIVVKDESGVVISKNKPVYATSSFGSSDPNVAVDGTEATRTWASGGVWHSGKQIVFNSRNPQTPNSDEEYWELDLGSKRLIGTITYYGRSDSSFERITGVRFEVSNSPRPRPFSSISVPSSWNDKSYLNSSTLTCVPTSEGKKTVPKQCDGRTLCVEEVQRDCTQGCTPGSSRNSQGTCEESPGVLLQPAVWSTTVQTGKQFNNMLLDSNGSPIRRYKKDITGTITQTYKDTTLNEMKTLCETNPACSGLVRNTRRETLTNLSNSQIADQREEFEIYLGAGNLINSKYSTGGNTRLDNMRMSWTGTAEAITIDETANTVDNNTPRNMCFKAAKDFAEDKEDYRGNYSRKLAECRNDIIVYNEYGWGTDGTGEAVYRDYDYENIDYEYENYCKKPSDQYQSSFMIDAYRQMNAGLGDMVRGFCNAVVSNFYTAADMDTQLNKIRSQAV